MHGARASKMRESSSESNENCPVVKRGRLRKTNQMGNSTIERITAAAREILVTEGVNQYSLDRIASRAGISKGTLLYHFQNKSVLTEFLMRQYVDHLQSQLKKVMDVVRQNNECSTPARLALEGFVEWYRHFRMQDRSYTAFGVSLLALSVKDDKARKPLIEWYEKLFALMRSDNDPSMVRDILTLEGLFFLRHFQVDPTKDDEIEEIISSILKLKNVQ